VTTTGRRSGRPHRIEIWFAAARDGRDRIYLLAGGRQRADWVRNLRRHADVRVEIGPCTFAGTASIIEGGPDDAVARRLVYEKYRTRDELEEWRDSALSVAIDLRP
jgi:deazaflavin-dependent oxidoreductase (nitroreductase family)